MVGSTFSSVCVISGILFKLRVLNESCCLQEGTDVSEEHTAPNFRKEMCYFYGSLAEIFNIKIGKITLLLVEYLFYYKCL
jgi:hypothetical protein